MRKAYVSCPVSVKQTELDKVVADLRSRGFEVTHWIRGTSYGLRETEAIRLCTHFIVMLPNNAFVCENLKGSCSGVDKEYNAYGETNIISRATSLLAYTSGNGLNYYTINNMNGSDGIQGSTGSSELFAKYNPHMKSGKLRFKTEEEFIKEYREERIRQGDDEEDIYDGDWEDEHSDWTRDHNHLFGTAYPYEEYKSDAEFFDEDGHEEVFIYESMLTEVKWGDVLKKHIHPNDNYWQDKRLLFLLR